MLRQSAWQVWLVSAAVLIGEAALGADNSASESQPKPDPQQVRFRVWTDISGTHKTEATFLGIDEGKVRLQKRDGNVANVPIEKLSRGSGVGQTATRVKRRRKEGHGRGTNDVIHRYGYQ